MRTKKTGTHCAATTSQRVLQPAQRCHTQVMVKYARVHTINSLRREKGRHGKPSAPRKARSRFTKKTTESSKHNSTPQDYERGREFEGPEPRREGSPLSKKTPVTQNKTKQTKKVVYVVCTRNRSSRRSSQHCPGWLPARSTGKLPPAETLSRWPHFRQRRSRWSPYLSASAKTRFC